MCTIYVIRKFYFTKTTQNCSCCFVELEVLWFATQVLVGRAAGRRDNNRNGGGTNHLCLTPSPTELGVSALEEAGSGEIYPLQYDTQARVCDGPCSGFERQGELNHYEMPCAVCIKPFAAGFSQWGSNRCPGVTRRGVDGYGSSPFCCCWLWGRWGWGWG